MGISGGVKSRVKQANLCIRITSSTDYSYGGYAHLTVVIKTKFYWMRLKGKKLANLF